MSEEFDAAVEPHRVNLASILEVGRTLRETHRHMPDANSEAMREVAQEGQFRHDWAQQPVTSAHSWAGVLLVAAEDHMKTICRIVVGDPSLFGPQSLARAGLEAAGRARWFAQTGIGARRRVARWQTERLHNLQQLQRLGQLSPTDAAAAAKIITGSADALGYNLLRGKHRQHTMIDEDRPTGADVFRVLLMDVPGQSGLGQTMFAFLSANDHATLYGLQQAMSSETTPAPDGRRFTAMAMNSHNTNLLMAVTTMGYVRAMQQYYELMGWADETWTKSAGNALSMAIGVTRGRQGEA